VNAYPSPLSTSKAPLVLKNLITLQHHSTRSITITTAAMTSQQAQELQKQLAVAKTKALQASASAENAGPLDLYDDTWEEVEQIQAELKAIEQEEAEREDCEMKQITKNKIDKASPASVIKAEDSEATATQPSQPRFDLAMVAAMTPEQLQEKLATARKELRRVNEEGGSDIEARNKVEYIRSQLKMAEKVRAERAEQARKARIMKIKKSESAEPERKPASGIKIERGFIIGKVKVENSNATGVQLPLRQHFHTSKADAAALRLQKAKDAYEDAIAGPASLPNPKQSIIDLDDDNRRTFLSFNGIRSKGEEWEIWNFAISKWVDWDVKNDPQHACWLLWEYAKRVLSVIYFCTHQCRSKDVEQYIPKPFYDQLYDAKSWATELQVRRTQLHGHVLRLQVQRNIVPRWKNNYGYPVTPYDAENDTEADKAARIVFFKRQAKKDAVALQAFVGGMGDSIDWEQITKKETDEDVAAWEWAVKSLAKAANLVHELGNDDEDGVQQNGQQQFSRLRNKYWETFPADKGEVAPHHSTIAILPHLGRGEAPKRYFKRKREPEEVVGFSIGKMRFDPKGRGFVDLTSDDEKMEID
jgi:hypothetical protein